jgi:hypothetical protein
MLAGIKSTETRVRFRRQPSGCESSRCRGWLELVTASFQNKSIDAGEIAIGRDSSKGMTAWFIQLASTKPAF